MRKLVFTFFLYAFFGVSVSPAKAADLARLEPSVVKIFTTRQFWNVSQPWTKMPATDSTCTGFFIREGILTNGHCVAAATYIEVEIPGHPDRIEAEVKAVNHQVDLSLIRLKGDDRPFRRARPITFGSLPNHRQKVVTVGYPTGGRQISYTEGVVSRIDILPYVHSNQPNLIVQTDAAINPGNSGGPVFSDTTGECLGVATQKNTSGEGLGYFVPALVVQQFLKDADDGSIEGTTNLGIQFQSLESDALRAYLKLKSGQTGVRVTGIATGSTADGILQKDDVILSINGQKIFNDGRIPFRDNSKIGLAYLMAGKEVGEELPVMISRNGEVMNLSLKLKPYISSVIPDLPNYDTPPAWAVIGGVVLMGVEGMYLYRWGGPSSDRLPPSIRPFTQKLVGEDGIHQLVVIAKIYNAPVNRGYGPEVENIRVAKINGRDITRMRDAQEALADIQGRDWLEIELEGGQKIVLDLGQIAAQDEMIRARYNIK